MEQASQSAAPLVNIGILNPAELVFYKNPQGFIAMKKGEENYKRVRLTRAMPLTDPFSYIAVSDTEGKEIGILKSVSDMPADAQKLIEEELSGCYYCPVITEILSIREKLGYFYFDVKLGGVKKLFAVKDISRSIKQLDEGGIIISDVDGNRFIISNIESIHKKSRRKLEPYLY